MAILQERKIQERMSVELNAEIEVPTEAGNIDLLSSTEIIEIKTVKSWKGGLGQVLVYGNYYPNHSKRLHVFGKCHPSYLDVIKKNCEFLNVAVSWESAHVKATTQSSSRFKKRRRKPITVRTTDDLGRRTWWTRSEIRLLLGGISNLGNKSMSEATFKRRLALLEEECPECDRVIHARKFSDFTKWCLVELEQIFMKCDRDINKTRKHLQNIGLNTDEYDFTN